MYFSWLSVYLSCMDPWIQFLDLHKLDLMANKSQHLKVKEIGSKAQGHFLLYNELKANLGTGDPGSRKHSNKQTNKH